MKKLVKLFLFVLVVLAFISCSTRMPYHEAGLVGNVIEKDYEVLGPVSVSGSNHNVLGIIGWGGIGYNDLLEKAKELYPETDAVINITEDVKSFSVWLFYNSFGMDLSGLAIKYIDNLENHSVNLNVSMVDEQATEF